MISIIMPTLNAAPILGPALAALAEGLREGVVRELILADAGSTDDTAAIADGVGARVIAGPADRRARLTAAAGNARGPWLLFVDPAFPLSPDWPAAAAAHIAQWPAIAGWFPICVGAATSGAAARLAELRARAVGRPTPAHGLLIGKDLYARLGGHADEAAFLRALGRRRLRRIADVAASTAARYQTGGRDRAERGWRR
jgi:glycosyltransferase involved in cell wall biosynthesis